MDENRKPDAGCLAVLCYLILAFIAFCFGLYYGGKELINIFNKLF